MNRKSTYPRRSARELNIFLAVCVALATVAVVLVVGWPGPMEVVAVASSFFALGWVLSLRFVVYIEGRLVECHPGEVEQDV